MAGEPAGHPAAGTAKAKRVSAPMRGHFAAAKVEPKRKVAEFRVAPENLIEVGEEIIAAHYFEGQFVDVSGVSIGKGFAGAMKRPGFKGLRASHGVAISHRSQGSTGQCQDPGKVFKGKKMAGHMGAVRTTAQNLRIVSTDVERGLILIRGGVPGPESGIVFVSDAIKKDFPTEAPFPASVSGSEADDAAGGDASGGDASGEEEAPVEAETAEDASAEDKKD